MVSTTKIGKISFETLIQSAIILLVINTLEFFNIMMITVQGSPIFRSSAEYGVAVVVIFIMCIFMTNFIFSYLYDVYKRIKSIIIIAILESIFFLIFLWLIILLLDFIGLMTIMIENILIFFIVVIIVIPPINILAEYLFSGKKMKWFDLESISS